jgi:hypothetical protein
LTYASVFWWKKTTQSSVVQKISCLQRLACMCVTVSMRSTPTSVLETLLMVSPLGNGNVCWKLTKENPLLLAPSYKIESTKVFDRKFSVEFSESSG